MRIILLIWAFSLGLTSVGKEIPAVRMLVGSHAHNDYEHKRPLLDALDHGFQSVEADIFLIGDQLLVAHDREDVDPKKTLRALYLDPLRERVKMNKGAVYAGEEEPFYLLIDLKSSGEPTYRVLHQLLAGYEEMLTTFLDGKAHQSAVTVIISGSRPRELMMGQAKRFAGYDGRMSDLEQELDPVFMPWISDNWGLRFGLQSSGKSKAELIESVKTVVDKAHAQGVKVRFWAIPDKPEYWGLMQNCGVDFINTDNLSGLRDFLTQSAND